MKKLILLFVLILNTSLAAPQAHAVCLLTKVARVGLMATLFLAGKVSGEQFMANSTALSQPGGRSLMESNYCPTELADCQVSTSAGSFSNLMNTQFAACQAANTVPAHDVQCAPYDCGPPLCCDGYTYYYGYYCAICYAQCDTCTVPTYVPPIDPNIAAQMIDANFAQAAQEAVCAEMTAIDPADATDPDTAGQVSQMASLCATPPPILPTPKNAASRIETTYYTLGATILGMGLPAAFHALDHARHAP